MSVRLLMEDRAMTPEPERFAYRGQPSALGLIETGKQREVD